MKICKIVLALSLLMASSHVSPQSHQRLFAIVVDPAVSENCGASIDAYARSIRADGLETLIIVDKWHVPDSIRVQLQQLYLNNHLEGAVFIGDIPVPMIRDAQHLTTAFKMDQRRPWDQSSIPSDRFYDDFDLQFEYLKQDSLQPLLHYYSLSPKGAQTVKSEIYTARIKPPKYEGKSRFDLISTFLEKAVREKASARRISQITYFAGNGYHSNSLAARIDERFSLTNQFSVLTNGKGKLNYIDHTYDEFIKGRLMAELEREDLDLAILHHHGAEDTQYLNASPYSIMADKWLEMARKFFRSKIRSAKDTTASKQYYIEKYNVPESWVNNAFDPAVMLKDSLADAAMDIHIDDLKNFTPAARFIMLDACFNGSFHLEDYISGHYIFNPGHTVVVKANSVNTLQDIWSNQLIGLLELGVSVGNWAKEQFTLESHLIGDPTYMYAASREGGDKLNFAMAHKKDDTGYWKKLLKDKHPEVRALAMKRLAAKGAISPEQLFSIQRSDSSPTARLMAYRLIKKSEDNLAISSILAGLRDDYELLNRFAAIDASENQSPQLLDELIGMWIAPGTSQRVSYQVKGAVELYEKEAALAAYDKALEGKQGIWYDERRAERGNFERILISKESDMKGLLDPATETRNNRFTITALRNSQQAAYLDTLFRFMRESHDQTLRQLLAEALGWYTQSWRKQEIIDFCKSQIEVEKDDLVKRELQRTLRRLTD
ncbi:hypothetical protein [Petrimonas mucosa]|jgi:hypothetical protein|uniref:hypothetical protein n=1 Tax=Petrimonas mucosa TaxID=1642646 RepID=UPI001776552B|nr:hypothetical protein [Petrimonas mucosa]MDD3561250.1 hypothetical protein [Petrimonas mucosa]HHT29049.1 HEAT repeat domain-containing protein [Petrimonas mucosa]